MSESKPIISGGAGSSSSSDREASFMTGYYRLLPGCEGYSRIFGLEAEWKSQGKTQRLQYQFSMEWVYYHTQQCIAYRFEMYQPFYQGEALENPVYLLAVGCVDVLYPLEIRTDLHAHILDIPNMAAIQKRWQEKKPKLLQEFEGEAAKKYIDTFEQRLTHDASFIDLLYNQWMYAICMQHVYIDFGPELSKAYPMAFRPMPFAPTQHYTGNLSCSPYIEEDQSVRVQYHGKTTEDLALEIEYALEKRSKILANAHARFQLPDRTWVALGIYHQKQFPTTYISEEAHRVQSLKMERAINKEKRQGLSLKQRFLNWLDT
ncbi:MAG: hypothetical protein OIF50_17660 [Flavobacteriaceae bacterium]|nr:hypothetical protein [Flavobacteriaceae bacterium]